MILYTSPHKPWAIKAQDIEHKIVINEKGAASEDVLTQQHNNSYS
jgi:hypothetical protein